MSSGVGKLFACAAILGLVAACTPESNHTPPTQTSREQPAPKDRDKRAVLAALRQLDLCALLDPAIVATPSLPAAAKPATDRPFGCEVTNLPGQRLSVTATSITWNTRRGLPIRQLGGAKAYVQAGSFSDCDIYVPVSFTLAIEFGQDARPGTPADAVCQSTADLVAAAATVLADPAAVQVEPVWDPCSALEAALGPDSETKLAETTVDMCGGVTGTVQTILSFASESLPRDTPLTETIGDKQVQIFQQEEHCEAYWRQGPVNSRYARAADHQVRIVEPDCARARKLTASVIDVLNQPPSTDVAPQQPLLYQPDEPDGPFLGACAYVDPAGDGRCEPSVQVQVPAESADIRKAVDADPNVLCAMLRDPVGQHIGAGFLPVTVADAYGSCYFGTPEKLIQVAVTMPSSSAREAVSGKGREVTIAGHPGYAFAEAGSYRYVLATSANANADGAIELRVSTGPATSAVELPAGTDKNAEAVLADVLQTHF